MHYKYHEEELQAKLKSEINPFPLHSDWVDRDIKVGDIDEEVCAAIFCLFCYRVLFVCVRVFVFVSWRRPLAGRTGSSGEGASFVPG